MSALRLTSVFWIRPCDDNRRVNGAEGEQSRAALKAGSCLSPKSCDRCPNYPNSKQKKVEPEVEVKL